MGSSERLENFRKHKDEYFASGDHSPLEPEDLESFKALQYFPYNPSLQFALEPDASGHQGARLTLDTIDGKQVDYLIAGIVRFSVGDGEYELTLLKDAERGRYFLPFYDATTGLETYKGGRYLDPQQRPDGSMTIDFNYAYNPYCAYSGGWSCPYPPEQNRLSVAIDAGEKSFRRGAD